MENILNCRCYIEINLNANILFFMPHLIIFSYVCVLPYKIIYNITDIPTQIHWPYFMALTHLVKIMFTTMHYTFTMIKHKMLLQ